MAGDRVQPGLEVDRPLVAQQLPVSGRERVLDGVLGLLARAEQMPAEAEDGSAVALEGDLEGGFVAAADLLNQPLVAGERKQATGAQQRWTRSPSGDRERFHPVHVLPAVSARHARPMPPATQTLAESSGETRSNSPTSGLPRRFSTVEPTTRGDTHA
jgi:hypothetical protein